MFVNFAKLFFKMQRDKSGDFKNVPVVVETVKQTAFA